MDANAALTQLGRGGIAVGVATEGTEEVDLVGETGEDGGGNTAAPRRTCEGTRGVCHFACMRKALEGYEVNPFDVTDDGDSDRHAAAKCRVHRASIRVKRRKHAAAHELRLDQSILSVLFRRFES